MIKNLTLLLVIVYSINGCTKGNTVRNEDIYVDRLVYQKKDSSLFSGTLKIVDESSSYFKSFCSGIPYGEWGEYEKGGYIVHKGKYLDKNILSKFTHQLIATDTFLINHWQESELSTITYPPFFTIIILKENDFFKVDKSQYEDYFNQLANVIVNDSHSLQYDYLHIRFVNAVHGWSKDYYKGYKLENGKLMNETPHNF